MLWKGKDNFLRLNVNRWNDKNRFYVYWFQWTMINLYSIYLLNSFNINIPISLPRNTRYMKVTQKLSIKMNNEWHNTRFQRCLLFGQTIFFNCQREMYINIHAKHSSLLQYCYVTQFYSLWDSIIPEVIVGFCQIFFWLNHLPLSDLGVRLGLGCSITDQISVSTKWINSLYLL